MQLFSRRYFVALAVIAPVFLAPPRVGAKGGEWTTDLKASVEQKTAKASDTPSVTTLTREETIDLKYTTQLDQTLDLTSSFNLGRKTVNAEDDFDTTEKKGKADLAFKAKWWNLALVFDESVSGSDDTSKPSETTTTKSADLKIEPTFEGLPKLSYKIEDKDDTQDQSFQGTIEYELAKMVKLKAEAQKDISEVKTPDGEDSDARKFKAEMTFYRDFWTMWKFEAKAAASREQQLSLDQEGFLLEKQDKTTREYSSKLALNPLKWIDASFEFIETRDNDLMLDEPVQVSDKTSGSIKMTPKPTEKIDLELGYTNQWDKSSGSNTDSTKTSNEYNLAAKWTILKLMIVEASYDRKDDRDDPDSGDEISKETRNDDYKYSAEMKFWMDQISLKAEQTFKETWDGSEKTAEENALNFEGNGTLKSVPNLEFKPTYTFKSTEDRVEGNTDKERKLEVVLNYAIVLGKVTNLKFDHTYRRTDKEPGSGDPATIMREDDSTANVRFSDFLRDMSLEFSAARKASDESLDDVGPEIDYKYTAKYELVALTKYKFSLEYQYDDNQEAEDGDSLKASIDTQVFRDKIELSLSYDQTRKFGAEKTEDQTILFELTGKF